MVSKEEFLVYFQNETNSLNKDNLYVIYEYLNKDYPELHLDTDFDFIDERKIDYLFLLSDALAQDVKEVQQYHCGWGLPSEYRYFYSLMYKFPINMDRRQQRKIKDYFQMKTKMVRDYYSLSNYIKIILGHLIPVKKDIIDEFNKKISSSVELVKQKRDEKIVNTQKKEKEKIVITDNKGGIYGIYENSELVYIGMTMRPFEVRWKEHQERIEKGSTELALYGLIDANAKIEFKKLLELDKMECNDKITKRDLQAMEFALIQEHRPKYNFAGRSQPYQF